LKSIYLIAQEISNSWKQAGAFSARKALLFPPTVQTFRQKQSCDDLALKSVYSTTMISNQSSRKVVPRKVSYHWGRGWSEPGLSSRQRTSVLFPKLGRPRSGKRETTYSGWL